MKPIALLVACAAIAFVPHAPFAHGPVARVTDTKEFQNRLFVADAASGEVVALDVPSGEVVARLQTPPYIMQLGLSADSRYLFATRGRNTDKDFVTIIDTGIDSSFTTARPPFVARTISARTPGGIRGGRVASVGGNDALFMEGSAEIFVMNTSDYSGMAGIEPRIYQLANPDHYHYLESGRYLYVGHLRSGMVQILDRETGDEVKRIENCPALHGMAKDQATGRLLFSCRDDVVVIGSRGNETNLVIERVGFPEQQRTAAFQWGAERVIWGYTEGTLPMLYRMDLKVQPWRFDVLPVDKAIQQRVTEDGRYLLVLTRAGDLLIHDGTSGEFRRKIRIATAIEDDLHEHVDKAILPAIATADGSAFVSLPHEGRIVQVGIEAGIVEETYDIGGEPTRVIVLSSREAIASHERPDQAGTPSRWFTNAQLARGKTIYDLNCTECHGERGQGNYGKGGRATTQATAPSALNGSGSIVEQSLTDMVGAIDRGFDPGMPAFKKLLTNEEKLLVIAYYQTFWPQESYDRWAESNESQLAQEPVGNGN